jgi:hypothetical protein
VDLYSDLRDCLGDSDSMACYMAAAGVGFIAMGALEGPSNNVARRAAKAVDVGDAAGDVARRAHWDEGVKRWRDPNGRFAQPPDELARSSIRWSQGNVSLDLYWPSAGDRISLDEAVERLRAGEVPAEPLLVFQKTPSMDKWPTTSYVTSEGRVFTGSYANLEDWAIYSINNRTLTALTAAGIDTVPVRWATRREIIERSYQFSTPNRGIAIQLKFW